MGIRDVRLTGGEPLVRRELPRLVGMLAAIPGLHDLSLTTNGYQLERDAEALVSAGVTRFNVSVDSLQRERFSEMTRRDALDKVLRGLEVLASFPEAHPIKVNAVAMRGFTEQEVLPFARFARSHPYEVRFIEFMPLDADHAWSPEDVLTGEEVRAAIDAVYPLEPEPREPNATARTYRFADGHRADRLHQPRLRAVLRRLQSHPRHRRRPAAHLPVLAARDRPARGAARRRATTTSSRAAIRDAVWRKELKHHVGDAGFVQPARSMSAIGG